MALFDFLKRKKATAASSEPRHGREKAKSAKKPEKKVQPEKADVVPAVKQSLHKKTRVFSYDAIKHPHISEKATALAGKNQYTFETLQGVNKTEIKKAIEGIYGVNVLSVNIIKIPAKKRRMGKTQGFKSGHIKAIVKIKEGQIIEIF